MPRALTGIRPSGNVHIGNYLGAIRPAVALQNTHECFYFIADMHSLTTTKDGKIVRNCAFDVVATWIAAGIDPSRCILYRQSDLPWVGELAWYLSCVTGMGLLEKAHAYKDAVADQREVNHGFFAYPVLMAADILMYEADIVPVGKDQKQHVEITRDIAGSFNAVYGEGLLKLPEPLIHESVMLVPGLDGRKMSKSYNNEIPLFCSESELRKKVMSLKTDSTPVEASKSMKGSWLGEFFTLFASEEKQQEVEARLKAGGYGWGHAKEELFQCINSMIKEPRQKYAELRNNETKLAEILDEGAHKAYIAGLPVIERVRAAVGMRPSKFHMA